MKAMIFAAGLGTRLRPLTNDKPKALVEVKGKSLLEITINRLIENEIDKIIINVHHFADQVIHFVNEKKFKAKIVISDERDNLLDTGGGLKKAKWFFDDQPFLVHNVDIVSDIDLRELYNIHVKNNSLATVAVRNRKSSRYFLFDNDMILCGWENINKNEQVISRRRNHLNQFAFSGIQIMSPKIFDFFPNKDVFSIIDVYLTASKHELIKGYLHNYSFWQDVGKIEDLHGL